MTDKLSLTLPDDGEPNKWQLVVTGEELRSGPAVEFQIQEWTEFREEVYLNRAQVLKLRDFLAEWLEQ